MKKKTYFGQQLVGVRLRNNVSQKEMAVALGVTSSYLCAVENGRKHISDDFLSKVLAYIERLKDREVCELEYDAAISNGYVSILGLPEDSQELVAGVALALRERSISDVSIRKIWGVLSAGK